MKVETVVVQTKTGDLIINKSDYDEKNHKLASKTAKKPAKKAAKKAK